MGLQGTPKGERFHIVLFGKRNAGKSSLFNAITNQSLAIVSEVPGTTTDPVSKAMEILPLGPCLLTDTPGLDDEGTLGEKRIGKALEELYTADVVLMVIDVNRPAASLAETGFFDPGASVANDLENSGMEEIGQILSREEVNLIKKMDELHVPYFVILNQADRTGEDLAEKTRKIFETVFSGFSQNKVPVLLTSTLHGTGIEAVKERLGSLVSKNEKKRKLVGDLIHPGEIIVLVVPIDSAAPKGRLILPQQQVIRDILDHHALAVVSQPGELAGVLEQMNGQVRLVITDSQAFKEVDKIVPKDIFLTSFSILFARYKGNLEYLLEGVDAVLNLQDGDKVLMAEGCTHHRQCGDIGTVKIPRLLRKKTAKELVIETSSGAGFPKNLSGYSLIVHCGGCTLHEKEMKHRMEMAEAAGVPMVNYGIFLAYANGILERSIQVLQQEKKDENI